MELSENSIIQRKLNNLDSLPEGYLPNLESKWSMLEAGLDGKRNRFLWSPLAAAVVLILLGGSVFLIHQLTVKPVMITGKKQYVKPYIHKPPVDVKQKKINSIPFAHQQVSMEVLEGLHDTIIVNQQAPPAVTAEIADIRVEPVIEQTIIKRKKTKFVEIDFNETSVILKQIDEPSVAFKPFHFGQNAPGEPGPDRGFGLYKSF